MADEQDDKITGVEGLDPAILQQVALLGARIAGDDDEIEVELDKGMLSRQRLNEHMIDNGFCEPVDESEVAQATEEPEHDDMDTFLAENGITPASVDEVSTTQDVDMKAILEEVDARVAQSEKEPQQPIQTDDTEPKYAMDNFLAENGITSASVDEPDQTVDFDEILAQMDGASVEVDNNANLPKVKSLQQDVMLPNM